MNPRMYSTEECKRIRESLRSLLTEDELKKWQTSYVFTEETKAKE